MSDDEMSGLYADIYRRLLTDAGIRIRIRNKARHLAAPSYRGGYTLGQSLGIVTRLSLDASGRTALATKEYPGGVRGEFEVKLPAVLGIQAAEKPPRYVPVAKVRAAMKTQKIDSAPASLPADGGCAAAQVVEMKRNEPAGHAEMLDGDPESVSDKLCGILTGHGLL